MLPTSTAPAASPISRLPAARPTPLVAAAPAAPLSPPPSAIAPQPSEDEVRDYAHHLYVQRGGAHGHDCDDWLEARACLSAHIPKESTQTRMHQHTQIVERAALPLVKHGRS